MSAFAPTSASAGRGIDHSFLTGVTAALAGLMFGLDIGVISGALQFIGTTFHASDTAKEWIVSSMMFGAALGASRRRSISPRSRRRRSAGR
jgi:SP family galactose:H+ symporter-like MFS transporter